MIRKQINKRPPASAGGLLLCILIYCLRP